MRHHAVYSHRRLATRTFMTFLAAGLFTSLSIVLVRLDKNRLLPRGARGIIRTTDRQLVGVLLWPTPTEQTQPHPCQEQRSLQPVLPSGPAPPLCDSRRIVQQHLLPYAEDTQRSVKAQVTYLNIVTFLDLFADKTIASGG